MLELIAIAAIIAGAGYAVCRRLARTVRRFTEPCGTGCGGCGGGCESKQTPQTTETPETPEAQQTLQLVQLGRKSRAT